MLLPATVVFERSMQGAVAVAQIDARAIDGHRGDVELAVAVEVADLDRVGGESDGGVGRWRPERPVAVAQQDGHARGADDDEIELASPLRVAGGGVDRARPGGIAHAGKEAAGAVAQQDGDGPRDGVIDDRHVVRPVAVEVADRDPGGVDPAG